ncbi:asparagine synthase (glutamine-hydrolyzing) [Aliarcobacter cryaerophilus]|uniref:asparagine synthase (glutamine-hydrolyzing) n=2 Tax=Aliarcobacter cryaerophilus TaxID=28198 RepID=A0A2S9SKV8_9BACT|nr:asparagine synthase (glutamine-hydrolyzing) [Aliarcobacter cryaerophilus]PRM87202.1 asparagine synthase (glutamine-hydrolyzing) [Aliarcobacter cryaerophilus]
MCGISGFCDFKKKSSENILKNMTDALIHRGPDSSGYSFFEYETYQVGLGHRRLSILDLSTQGHQPMKYKNLEIVYNGEIYNFKEIRKELEDSNYIFGSNTDTEVILKAYDKWGLKMIDRFIGMFAIVIYDKTTSTLLCIRDRAGVKPLYYYFKDGLFLFASELKSFYKHKEFQKQISKEGLSLFFQYGYILEPYSIFEDTYKLKAGHYLKLDLKTSVININKYWDVIDFYNKPKLDISFEEAKQETEQLLKSACEYRMVSDVPVGIFLSGGYDSSAVAAILQKDRIKKLKTFSIGFYEKKYNEAHYAKDISKHLGTEHTEYYCTQKDAQDLLPLIGDIWDEPFGDKSNIPTLLVSKLARKEVTVSLSADGGDEVFGGYGKYTEILKYNKLFLKRPISNNIANLLDFIDVRSFFGQDKSYKFLNKYERFKLTLKAENEIDVLKNSIYCFLPSEVKKLLNNFEKNIETCFDDIRFLNQNNDSLDKIMAIDYKTYQLDDILVKVDRATMSVGLEGREPLLDHRIIEFVSTLPSKYKIKNGEKKYILKEIVHNYIPKELMDRPKMGFGFPLKEWFGDELKKYILEYLDSEKITKIGLLNVQEVEVLKKDWLVNNRNLNKLWLILNFVMWYERNI